MGDSTDQDIFDDLWRGYAKGSGANLGGGKGFNRGKSLLNCSIA